MVQDEGDPAQRPRLGRCQNWIAFGVQKLTMPQIISEIKASGLRGRGGAGFPSGMKWVCHSTLGVSVLHTDIRYSIVVYEF